ncbi:DUF4347 domain-containing protein [Massilia sp. SM-13]|uniref:DUF4347 domain-containing protein n=1 Tax=Pseudoduganella rhizocola TaxID=3382643 RepID=UPI0038B4946A
MTAETNMPMPGNSKHEIAFIDTSVSGYETLLAGVRDGVEVVLIDGAHDGLAQIAAVLAGRSGIDALHILSHGSEGALALGSGTVDLDGLDSHGAELAVIRSALGEQADVLLYGCNVAGGAAGTAFTSRLAELTGADVAASEDLSGSSLLGGNWQLERELGSIEAGNVLSGPVSFSGLLAAPADENFQSYAGDLGTVPATPRTLGGFNYLLDGGGTTYIVDSASFGLTATTNNTLVLNADAANNVRNFTLQSTSLSDNFAMTKLSLESFGGTASVQFTVKGYDGGTSGTLRVSEDITITASFSGTTMSYVKNPSVDGGVLNFGAAWGSVDTIVFTATDGTGLYMAIDTIDVSPADTTAPTVSSVSVPSNATYVVGQNLDFTVTFSENLTLTGSGSKLGLTIGSTAQEAAFLSSTGNTVTYRYTVQAGDVDANGITVGSLTLGGHTIRDVAGNNAVLTLNSVGATGSVLVDGVAPAVSGNISVPANDTYIVGEVLNFTVTFDDDVTLAGSASTLGLTVGSTARNAAVTGSTSNSITYSYTVQAGDSDANGIAVTGISLNGGTIRDAAGNDASVSLSGHLPSLTGVLVDGVAPAVSGNISVPANDSYRAGEVLSFTVTFDENVTVTGTDSVLGLTIGSTARDAVFGSKTANSITYTYTVQAGDTDANGIAVGSITLGATTIKDAAGNDAVLTLAGHLPSTAGILVDTTAPAVTSVSVPSNASYVAGQNLDFTVNFGENVTVTGSGSTLGLTIGSTAQNAVYLSSTGSTVTYRYTVQAGDVDADGITVGSLALNGDTIRDAAGNDAVLTLNSVGATGSVLVDAVAPSVSGNISVPGNDTYTVGETLAFTVTFDENVTLGGSASTLGLTVGSSARNAIVTGSTANTITYSYTVQAGDSDANGIAVTGISLNGGTIRDAAGNDASVSLSGHLPSLAGVLVDGVAPAVSGNIAVPADASYRVGQTLTFTVTFDDNVTVSGTDSVLGLTIGSTARDAVFDSKTANSITYTYTVQAGDTDANGIAVGSITLGSSTIRDAAGNDAVLTLSGHLPSTTAILVDTAAPAVASVSVPSNGTYVAGQNLDFTVNFGENVTVTGSDSELGLTIGSTARSAELLSSSGSTATYRYTVQAGDVDADGITVGSLTLNGDTIRDAAGNDAVLSLNSVGATGSVLVDGTVPGVSGTISVPVNDTYVVGETLSFTVTFDENVTLSGTSSTLGLTVGSTARNATVTGSTANSITYSYTVQNGDNDADGIAVTGIALNGGTIRDAAGNNASLTLTGHLPSLAGVLVDGGPPSVSGNISVPADGSYHAGQTLYFTVAFDENVTVAGTDSVLGLTIGSTARNAVFDSKTASSITYAYTVQAGDTDANGIVVGAITLGSTTIKDVAGNDAVLTLSGHLPSTTAILVDTTAPAVASVSVPSNATYVAGQNMDFTVTFDESVTVTGTDSTLGLTIGSTARSAVLLSSTGSTATYRYTVQAGDVDANGITVGSLSLNGGTIRDAAGNDAVLTLNSVGATGSVLVDGTVPSVTGTISAPGNDTYVVGETLDFTVTFDENITRAGTASTLGLTVGGTARNAVITATTANSITYSYTVQNGDNDTDGIAVTGISLNGGTIRDSAGNDADLGLASHLPALTGVLVDGGPPSVSGNISLPANASYNAGDVLRFTVTFDENVTLAGSGSTLGLTIGSTAREAAFETSTANSITYAYTVQAGDTDANGIAVGAITLNGHTIKDAAGNNAVLTLTSHVPSTAGILVDTTAPQVASVSVPSNATYVAGQNLDFTVTFDENVSVTGAGSTLGLTIGSTAHNAAYLSSTGNTVTYRYTVQAGDVDADGITVGSLSLNGGTIRDAAGNDAVLTLNSVGSTGSVLVDGIAPAVTGTIAVPGNDTYVAGDTLSFTVTFDDNVTLSGTPSTLGLTVGSTARNATVTGSTANSITYSYTVQSGDNDADGIAVTGIALNGGTIRDAAGNEASLSLTSHVPALTGVLADTAAPSLLTATVNGATMVLTYSDAGLLDAANVPPTSAFGVLVAGSPVLVSAVAVNAAAHTVTLTLASAVSSGQAVSVAYADPTAGNDVNAVQDAAGNDAASLASIAVVNNTPSPEAPPATGTVDGVPVQTGTVTNSDGSTSQVVTVPVVTPSRVEQVGNNTVADIPLVKDAGGASLLAVQVPVGVGLQASGGGQAKPAGNSLTDLIREIQAHTTAGSADQNQLTGGGSGFLGGLSNDTPLLVQTIVVTGNGGSSGTPLGIIGQPQQAGSVQTALVIDARSLPNGAALELQNVEFAAVIGAATVTGGAGSQHVWGDGASQNIFLGADDDVLHGGAGDDVVGSAGGNDEIYGDEGNDLVFGGEGNDRLDGGAGQDIARFTGRSDGYSVRMVDGKLVMAAQAGSDGTDTVAAVETLRFTGGQSSADDAVLARLYEGLLHRSASAAEVAYWQDVHARGVSMHDVAAAILGSDESGQPGNPGGAGSDSGFVAGLYQNVLGRTASAEESAYWTGLLGSGVDRATVALGFVNSAEKLASTLDLDFNHSDVAVLLRMYHALFGRAADEAGLNYWLGAHEQGASLGAIADAFTMSAEAQGLLSQGDNAAFIEQLYQTALERAPSAGEKALLLEQLQQGVFDRGQVLLNVAESAESIAIVGSIGTSIALL